MKKRWIRKIPFAMAVGALGVTAFSGAVMLLWNNILPAVLHISAITFWQAAGILVLSKILFSGFGGRGRMGWRMHQKQMFGKWQNMTEEEKDIFCRRAYCFSHHGKTAAATGTSM